MLVYELKAPDIDRLVDRFKPEWKEFFSKLDRSDRKQIRIYLNYRKSKSYISEWSFSPFTASVIARINQKAKTHWWNNLRCKQLTIFDYLSNI